MKVNWLKQVNLKGNVLDIGTGDGINLKYYSLYKKNINHITCVEPNVHLHTKLLQRAKQYNLPVELFSGTFEQFAKKNPKLEFDTITGIFVLCSVDNSEVVIDGLYSVLKLGGTLALFEHIKQQNNLILNIIQILFLPVHLYYGGGCNLRRLHASTLKKYKFNNVKEEYLTCYKILMLWMVKFYSFVGNKPLVY
ncbi:hypothetical protein LOD99_14059 [Oopsacas minuta]|uniref:Methyltransferase domain-containing protein n=1 Tax=Oopsacas minuta TaxID=111878 RepID=A0AAV7KIS9_9METZ|nr:hypothetical protein LOD99_14059 [Oopsacas minuta]